MASSSRYQTSAGVLIAVATVVVIVAPAPRGQGDAKRSDTTGKSQSHPPESNRRPTDYEKRLDRPASGYYWALIVTQIRE